MTECLGEPWCSRGCCAPDGEPQDWWWDGEQWLAVPPGQLAADFANAQLTERLRKIADAIPALTPEQVRQELDRFHARLAVAGPGQQDAATCGCGHHLGLHNLAVGECLHGRCECRRFRAQLPVAAVTPATDKADGSAA